jgi:hypothetical protein
VDGLLLPPADVSAWRAALQALVESPERLARLREGVEPPQSLARHADDLHGLLEDVLRR